MIESLELSVFCPTGMHAVHDPGDLRVIARRAHRVVRSVEHLHACVYGRPRRENVDARDLMAKTKRNIGPGDSGRDSANQAWGHGRITNEPSVSSVREKAGLSQSKFATLLDVSVRTLQEWEQERRAPSGAARTLLLIAAKESAAVTEVA